MATKVLALGMSLTILALAMALTLSCSDGAKTRKDLTATFFPETDHRGQGQTFTFSHYTKRRLFKACTVLPEKYRNKAKSVVHSRGNCVQLCTDLACRICIQRTSSPLDLKEFNNRIQSLKGCCLDCS